MEHDDGLLREVQIQFNDIMLTANSSQKSEINYYRSWTPLLISVNSFHALVIFLLSSLHVSETIKNLVIAPPVVVRI